MSEPIVVAVCASPRGGVPKHPQPGVTVTPLGVEGDHHAGATRFSRKQRRLVPNDRSITVVAQEALDDLNARLGIALKPGDLAENVLVRGLGDLSDLRAGDRIVVASVGGRVTLRVTEQNMPCKLLLPYHEHMVKASYEVGADGEGVNRRGVACVVDGVEGDGVVRAGDAVSVERAPR